jgi:hypothetical protein
MPHNCIVLLLRIISVLMDKFYAEIFQGQGYNTAVCIWVVGVESSLAGW